MTRQAVRLLVMMAAVAHSAAAARLEGAQNVARAHVLDVPYLPQSEDLCGGAAAAMVMRFWGARDLYADAFASLVDHSAGGIRTDRLVQALQQRSWTTLVQSGDPAVLQAQLDRGRPVIALIEDRPSRFHYVVVVSWTAGHVLAQDPARAPLRSISEDAFLRAWDKSQRWMLVLLPPAALTAAAPADSDTLTASSAPASCSALVDSGVAQANAGKLSDAAIILERASGACPHSSAPHRELAGVAVLEKDWSAAGAEASRAVAIDASDQYAWNILATSRYMMHDDVGALDAWNRIRQPAVDLLNVQGLSRTRYMIAANAADLPPRTLLTRESLLRAERRLNDVPAFAAARVSFRPGGEGHANVEAFIVERDLIPRGYPALIAAGMEAAVDRSLSGSVSSFTGGGELLTVSARWWEHRSGVWLTLAAPAPSAIGGVWRLETSRETQAFGAAATEETRTHAGLTYGKWLMGRTRVEGTAGIDDWSDRGRRGVFGVNAQFWPDLTRFVLDANATSWPGVDGTFGLAGAAASWRSTTARHGNVWRARTSIQVASDAAPEFLWPGADTGHARAVLLRAHPLLQDGVIEGGVFGRQLVAAGAEWRRWLPSGWLLQVAPALFVDAARASRGTATTDDRMQVDAGAGIRVSLAGLGVVRLDVAHGLRDGRTALSIAIER